MKQKLKSILQQVQGKYRYFSNEKSTTHLITLLKKAFQFAYLILSLLIGLLYILTIPFWAPFVFAKVALIRCINFTKRVYDLPIQIFKPKLIEPIRYAILKGNGKYLRGEWEDPLLFQLYDYTLRKFMSVQQIPNQMKIAQIQCETLSQWKYFKQNDIKNITCLQSNIQFIQKQKQHYPQIKTLSQTYQIAQFSNQYDCMIALNIKQKLNKYCNFQKKNNTNSQKIDILKILSYLKHQLSSNGYIIYGQYFNEQGQIQVMQQLFQAYGFNIEQQQNIQRNIAYAEKLRLEKYHNVYEMQLIDKFVNKVKKIFGLKRDYMQGNFIVFVLAKCQKKK